MMNRLVLLELLLAGSATMLLAQGSPASQTNADQQAPTMVYNLPSQPVGVDDLLAVSVYDAPELTRTARVGPDGTIRLPMLKEKISVQGKLAGEIEAAIAEQLTKESILVEPVVTVSIAEYKSRPVSVVGAVKSPVTFQALPGTTLLDALTKAQGLSDDAGADIIVTRLVAGADGKTSEVTQRIPSKALLEKTDPLYNLPLSGGEQIRVPESGKIFVVGNVSKPGAISVHDTLGQPTVMKAIALSQGLVQYANKTAYIYRRADHTAEPTEIAVDLAKMMQRKAPDVDLLPDDVLYIPDNKSKRLTLGALEKTLMVGGGISAAAIYALSR